MRSRTVAKVVILTAFMFALAAPAAAQQDRDKQRRATSSSNSGSAGDGTLVGVGLSFLHDVGETGTGVGADFRLPSFNSSDVLGLGIVADVGINHFTGGTELQVGGGVRATFKINGSPKFMPFGQVLIGIAHTSAGGFSETDLYIGPGFGVDFAFNDNMNFRGQIDIRHVNATFGFTQTRFLLGVSFLLGKS